MKSWTIVILLASACGGKRGGGAVTPPAQKPPDPADLAKCGAQDQEMGLADGKFQDVEACKRYMVASFETGDSKQFSREANDIAEGLCVKNDGLGCRYRAIMWQTGVWTGRTDDLDARIAASASYLDMGCKNGDQESCAILKTKVDSKKRAWKLAEPEPPAE